MIVDRLVRALDDRLQTAPVVRKALAKIFPDHWSFMLGEIALYSFVALVLTGVYLTLFFEPSTARPTYYRFVRAAGRRRAPPPAYASTVRLSFDVRAGLLMRQTHHWAALVFVGAIVLHLLRIFFTGAFRKPREMNWLIGVTHAGSCRCSTVSPATRCPTTCSPAPACRSSVRWSSPSRWSAPWLAFLTFGGEFPG